MNRALLLCLLAAGSSLSGAEDRRRSTTPGTPAPAAAPAPAKGFDAFLIVVERNIFNPNRTGRTRGDPSAPAPREDEIALVGTMAYEKGQVAFFNSPEPAFAKAARVGESVGDFKVQRITAQGVDLLQGDKEVKLNVTDRLRRPPGGEWSVRAAPPPTTTPTVNLPTTGAAEPEPTGEAAEVLKRLLQKREKQLK